MLEQLREVQIKAPLTVVTVRSENTVVVYTLLEPHLPSDHSFSIQPPRSCHVFS